MHNGRKRRPGAVRLPLLHPGVNFNAPRDRRARKMRGWRGEKRSGMVSLCLPRPGICAKFDDARIRRKRDHCLTYPFKGMAGDEVWTWRESSSTRNNEGLLRYSTAYESRVNYGGFCTRAAYLGVKQFAARLVSNVIFRNHWEKFPGTSWDYDLRCTPSYAYSFSWKENIFPSPIVHYVNLTFLRGQREASHLTLHSVAFRFSYLPRRARWFPLRLPAHDKTAYHGNEDLCHFPASR